MKTATLESKFPLLAVENGCIISKDADITVAYRVELPELFGFLVLHLFGNDESPCKRVETAGCPAVLFRRLSFAAPIGILLTCNHIVNQYLFIDDSAEILRKFEQTARNMHSLSRYSRSNQINREWIEEYLNEAHSKGLVSIRAHCNVMAWSDVPCGW